MGSRKSVSYRIATGLLKGTQPQPTHRQVRPKLIQHPMAVSTYTYETLPLGTATVPNLDVAAAALDWAEPYAQ